MSMNARPGIKGPIVKVWFDACDLLCVFVVSGFCKFPARCDQPLDPFRAGFCDEQLPVIRRNLITSLLGISVYL